ncbi:DsbA family protein [Prevotella sp. oral taxon 475]|uniref:DsbA family protein n=1 Tax=Prevotella sp. oral taxon 475 TaxID=712471 RepID=UPI001BA476C5|nr:DsbA family protein [Prevotella sp. oral taxon 475]QUB47721.1 DsbA family protein [Prevotella sp. oral taxon 475]
MSQVIITNVTDPVCPWCWGEEPFFRKLETHFPGLIAWRHVMGGLVEDMNKNKPADIDADTYYNKENKDFITHCLETAEKHGMPIRTERFNLFSETENSSFPLCIAFKAAQIANAEKADLFLYNLRAAAMAEARQAIAEAELIAIADESGIDIAAFLDSLNDGSAERAFWQDVEEAKKLKVEVFPTFVFEYEGKQMPLKNFRDYNTMAAMIKAVSGGKLLPQAVRFSSEALLELMETHPRLSAEEVKEAFDFASLQDMEAAIAPLLASGELLKQPADNSYFIRKPAKGMACDLTTGICK